MQAVLDVFQRHDVTGSGFIERDLLAAVLDKIVSAKSINTEKLLAAVCPADQATLDYRAFIKAVFFEMGEASFPGLPGADLSDLQTTFACIDANNNGQLDKEEVLAAVRGEGSQGESLAELVRQLPALEPLMAMDTWEAAFQGMDTNRDNVITWFEFLKFFSADAKPAFHPPVGLARTLSNGVPEEDLLAVFACIDTNGNGTLEKDEVLKAAGGSDPALVDFCNQVPSLRPLLQPERWQDAFRALDTNGAGCISWFEFTRFFGQALEASNLQQIDDLLTRARVVPDA